MEKYQDTCNKTLVPISDKLPETDPISTDLITDLISCMVLYQLLYEVVSFLDWAVKFSVHVT